MQHLLALRQRWAWNKMPLPTVGWSFVTRPECTSFAHSETFSPPRRRPRGTCLPGCQAGGDVVTDPDGQCHFCDRNSSPPKCARSYSWPVAPIGVAGREKHSATQLCVTPFSNGWTQPDKGPEDAGTEHRRPPRPLIWPSRPHSGSRSASQYTVKTVRPVIFCFRFRGAPEYDLVKMLVSFMGNYSRNSGITPGTLCPHAEPPGAGSTTTPCWIDWLKSMPSFCFACMAASGLLVRVVFGHAAGFPFGWQQCTLVSSPFGAFFLSGA